MGYQTTHFQTPVNAIGERGFIRSRVDMDCGDILIFFLGQRNGGGLSKSRREQKGLANRQLCDVRIHLLCVRCLGPKVRRERMSVQQTITAHNTDRDVLREYIQ
jgi:hypothetical protein